MKMPMIGTYSPSGLGNVRLMNTTAASSLAWPTANRALFVPFFFSATITVKRLWVVTGTTGGTNNRSMGIYDEAGDQIVVSSNTVAGTANQVQFFDTTDVTLSPGSYYVGLSQNGTTATIFRWPGVLEQTRTTGIVQMASAYPLPATATFAAMSTGACTPIMGVCTTASP